MNELKRLIYQVSISKKPSVLYEFCLDSVSRYCKRHGIEHVVQTEPILKIKPDPKSSGRSSESYEKHGGFLPIYEKQNAFDLLHEYDQVAIIDADIYVRESAPNVFDELGSEYDFGGVIEREMPLTDLYKKKILRYSQGQYEQFTDVDWKWDPRLGAEFFNMGVMVLNNSFKRYLNGQTAREFLGRKEFKKFVDGIGQLKWSTDQSLLNYFIRKEKMRMKNLDWRWNALYNGIEAHKVRDAHLVHFFLREHLPAKGEDLNLLKKVIQLNP